MRSYPSFEKEFVIELLSIYQLCFLCFRVFKADNGSTDRNDGTDCINTTLSSAAIYTLLQITQIAFIYELNIFNFIVKFWFVFTSVIISYVS